MSKSWLRKPVRIFIGLHGIAWADDQGRCHHVHVEASVASGSAGGTPAWEPALNMLSEVIASLRPKFGMARKLEFGLSGGLAQVLCLGAVDGLSNWPEAQALAQQTAQLQQEWGDAVIAALDDWPSAGRSALVLYTPEQLVKNIQRQTKIAKCRCIGINPWWVPIFNDWCQINGITSPPTLLAFGDADCCTALVVSNGQVVDSQSLSTATGEDHRKSWLQRFALVHGVATEHLLLQEFDISQPHWGRLIAGAST